MDYIRAEGDFHEERYIYIYTAERNNKAEIRLEEQSEKAESCRENLWNEIQLKGPYKHRAGRSGQARLPLCVKTGR